MPKSAVAMRSGLIALAVLLASITLPNHHEKNGIMEFTTLRRNLAGLPLAGKMALLAFAVLGLVLAALEWLVIFIQPSSPWN